VRHKAARLTTADINAESGASQEQAVVEVKHGESTEQGARGTERGESKNAGYSAADSTRGATYSYRTYEFT
jgi:hypothetical protein